MKTASIAVYGHISLSVYNINYTLRCLECMCYVSSTLRRHWLLIVTSLTNVLYYLIQVTRRGGVAKWVARLTRDRWILVSREFETHQRPPLFP